MLPGSPRRNACSHSKVCLTCLVQTQLSSALLGPWRAAYSPCKEGRQAYNTEAIDMHLPTSVCSFFDGMTLPASASEINCKSSVTLASVTSTMTSSRVISRETPIQIAVCDSIALWNAMGTPSNIHATESSLFWRCSFPFRTVNGSSTYTCIMPSGVPSGCLLWHSVDCTNLVARAMITAKVSGAPLEPWAVLKKT